MVHDNKEVIMILVVVNNPAPRNPIHLPPKPAPIALIKGKNNIVKYITFS
jgi:hypothetical protein